MKQHETRVWLAGWFERAPEFDLKPAHDHWRAWRYLGDGGVWYARDNETYEVVRKDRCHACAGRCFIELGSTGTESYGFCPWPNPRRLVPPRGFNVCRICDGRGFVFIATKVNQG